MRVCVRPASELGGPKMFDWKMNKKWASNSALNKCRERKTMHAQRGDCLTKNECALPEE